MTEEKNKGGRPKLYTDPEEMQAIIDKYFDECDEQKEPYTISGLAIALEMTTASLRNYGNNDEFFATVKAAKARCEHYLEKTLYKREANVTGIIFGLKNNYNWKDDRRHEVTGAEGGPIQTAVSLVMPDNDSSYSGGDGDSSAS